MEDLNMNRSLGRLEGSVESIKDTVAVLSSSVTGLAETTKDIKTKVDSLEATKRVLVTWIIAAAAATNLGGKALDALLTAPAS